MGTQKARQHHFRVERLESRLALSGFGAPTFTSVDQTFIDPNLTQMCGFEVQVHVQGKQIIQTATEGNTTTTQLRVADGPITFTNLANGNSVTLLQTGLQRDTTTVNADGTVTTSISRSGQIAHLVVPGQGTVFLIAGRGTDPESIIDHGRNEQGDLFQAICAALS
jgi:hypothetical protein